LAVATDSWDKITAQNLAYWEALAAHRLGEPVEFFRNGGSTLTARELSISSRT